MRHEIAYRPTFAQLEVELGQGESVRAESGAMLSHTEGIDVETGMGGGFVESLKRSVFGGESFFLNRFVAREPGTVTFAPRLPGDVVERDLGTEPLFVQSSSFLVGSPEVELNTTFGGVRTFFAGEGLFLLRLTGPGRAFLSSFGAIDRVDLRAGERFTVDTGHVVAFDSSIPYSVRRIGGLTSTLLSGEGLVVEFEGPGTVWTQSRSPDAFLAWVGANVSSGGAVVPVDFGPDSAPADAPPGDARWNAGRSPNSGRAATRASGAAKSRPSGGRGGGGRGSGGRGGGGGGSGGRGAVGGPRAGNRGRSGPSGGPGGRSRR